MTKKRIHNGEMIISREPCPFTGDLAILVHLPEARNLKIWFTLEEAETVGETLINAVRKAEEEAGCPPD